MPRERRRNRKKLIKLLPYSKGFDYDTYFWICEPYLRPRRKRSKKKMVNQDRRDFKMLYGRLSAAMQGMNAVAPAYIKLAAVRAPKEVAF